MAADLTVAGLRVQGIELAVFDKDGTLMDVHAYWANMIRLRSEAAVRRLGLQAEEAGLHVRGLMDVMGVDVPKMRIKPEGPVGIKKREIVLECGAAYLERVGFGDQRDMLFEVFAEVDADSVHHFDEIIRPLPGLYEMFDRLAARGVLTAIATTDKTERARLCMEKLGLGNRIDLIIGADIVREPKPDPEIIFHICHRLGVEPARSVMVGDAPADVRAGLAAGCAASIGVETGMTPAGTLRDLTPHCAEGIHDIHIE